MPEDRRTDNLHDLYADMERDAQRDLLKFCIGVTVGLGLAVLAFLLGRASA